MIAFDAKEREKANINENFDTLNVRVLCAKLQFPPQIYLFFQNTYSDHMFCRFRIVWTSIFAFGIKEREKANINENIETLNFRVLCAKLQFPPQV